ncbi:uncharacterized protein [Physcomitrium patens]|uniref:uncharacterized protein n=1 Tax=Physcomitrium patens TaxID=3218 RepID=UPI000D17821B|nr:uncharacterized protein LOC112275179 [Physcomitrium patens]|eukprot:XP_024361064.1 uncharacterized protein LOC112275179 [Physcomitrella patens]
MDGWLGPGGAVMVAENHPPRSRFRCRCGALKRRRRRGRGHCFCLTTCLFLHLSSSGALRGSAFAPTSVLSVVLYAPPWSAHRGLHASAYSFSIPVSDSGPNFDAVFTPISCVVGKRLLSLRIDTISETYCLLPELIPPIGHQVGIWPFCLINNASLQGIFLA